MDSTKDCQCHRICPTAGPESRHLSTYIQDAFLLLLLPLARQNNKTL